MEERINKILDRSNGSGLTDVKTLSDLALYDNYSLRFISVKGFLELLYELLCKTDDDIERRVLDGIVPLLAENIDKLEDIDIITNEMYDRLKLNKEASL